MALSQICIVVPCYNEEGRFREQDFIQFSKNHPLVDFCFVNDGSGDRTSHLLKNLSEKSERFHYLDISANCGKAEAVRQGVVKMLTGDYSHIGFWDADLATPLEEIPSFCEILKLGKIEVVMGSRIRRLGGKIERKRSRHIMGRLFATVASLLLKLPVYDTQCGAKIFSKELCQDIFIRPFVTYWIFDVELLFRIKKARVECHELLYEFPLQKWCDVEGSKLKLRDFIKAPLELLKIYKNYC
jgi:dolichyl-phosphate beta-glucosyltransferase